MICPKDNEVCEQVRLDDVVVDRCRQCGGVWLEQTELRTLVQHFSIPSNSSVDELLQEWAQVADAKTAPADFWTESTVVCPRDRAALQKHYFAGSLIGIDQCLVCHAFWLDGGELQAIMQQAAPDPATDQLGRMFLRDTTKFSKEHVSHREARNALFYSVSSPSAALYTIGNVVVQTMLNFIKLKALQKDAQQHKLHDMAANQETGGAN